MADTVHMQSPEDGEIREVEATPDVLVPLMVKGWSQVYPVIPTTPAKEGE